MIRGGDVLEESESMGVDQPFQMLINAGARTRSVEVSADDEREVVGGDEIDEVFELFDGTRRTIYRWDDEGSPAVIEFEVEAFKFSMSRRSNVGGLQFMTVDDGDAAAPLIIWRTTVWVDGGEAVWSENVDYASMGIRWYPGFSQNEDVKCPIVHAIFYKSGLVNCRSWVGQISDWLGVVYRLGLNVAIWEECWSESFEGSIFHEKITFFSPLFWFLILLLKG